MTIQNLLDRKLFVVLGVALLVGLHILWEYTHGGVTVHYPLADETMPPISNWWGLLTVPLLTLLVLTLIQRRIKHREDAPENSSKVIFRNFLGALLFGAIAGTLWEVGAAEILQFFILLPLFLSLFIPVHRVEHWLGFVLGMTYTFGGVLPITIGLVLLLMSFVIHRGIRGGALWLWAKLSR
ncbi:MAG: hypothetical protein AAFO03_01755 [Bacteroidota bacterium]